MIKLELSEKDIFQIMAGSMEDRVNLLISESVMKEIDLETIKKIVENEINRVVTTNTTIDDDKLTDFIKLLQFVAYNRYKSKHSEEIATYVLDKLFEIICHDFF